MIKDLYSTLDLNLLRTFVVLTQELNMRKASERLFVSQPAISQSLAKLRVHFGDELFVKVQSGLMPTPFADKLYDSISPLLEGLASSINNTQEFDPRTFEKSLKIALSPVVLASLSGALYRAFKNEAPNADIELVSWSNLTPDQISKGDVYLGIGYEMETSAAVYAKKLIQLSGRVIVRKDHPIKKKLTTPYDYDGYEIASMVSPGWNDRHSFAAEIMREYGLTYKVGFRSELLMALIDIIQHSDMYMPFTNLFPIHQYDSLRSLDISLDGKPYTIAVYSYCHLKHRCSAQFRWLFGLITTVIESQIEINDK